MSGSNVGGSNLQVAILPSIVLLLKVSERTITYEGKCKRQLEADITPILSSDMFANGPNKPYLRHA